MPTEDKSFNARCHRILDEINWLRDEAWAEAASYWEMRALMDAYETINQIRIERRDEGN